MFCNMSRPETFEMALVPCVPHPLAPAEVVPSLFAASGVQDVATVPAMGVRQTIRPVVLLAVDG